MVHAGFGEEKVLADAPGLFEGGPVALGAVGLEVFVNAPDQGLGVGEDLLLFGVVRRRVGSQCALYVADVARTAFASLGLGVVGVVGFVGGKHGRLGIAQGVADEVDLLLFAQVVVDGVVQNGHGIALALVVGQSSELGLSV